jgi:hypothetical protein
MAYWGACVGVVVLLLAEYPTLLALRPLAGVPTALRERAAEAAATAAGGSGGRLVVVPGSPPPPPP